jgi:exosortase A-associated hydrolase 2
MAKSPPEARVTVPPALASFDLAADGYRFTLRYEPPAGVQRCGTVVLAPPFAEEMNRCRRMVALCSRRMADAGWRVIARDLLGCGDSSGEFSDATWKAWVDDLKPLLQEARPAEPLWLWGVRAGALLLPELLVERPDASVLLWQPATSGRTALNQFLRVKVAAAALGGRNRIDVKTLRASLESGRPIEIAGYTISAALAEGMDVAALALPQAFSGRVVWIEVSAIDPPSLAAAGTELCREWRARAVPLATEAVAGEAFWQTQDTAECEEMLTATLASLEGDCVAGGSATTADEAECAAFVGRGARA